MWAAITSSCLFHSKSISPLASGTNGLSAKKGAGFQCGIEIAQLGLLKCVVGREPEGCSTAGAAIWLFCRWGGPAARAEGMWPWDIVEIKAMVNSGI